jgi:hypothetical protein
MIDEQVVTVFKMGGSICLTSQIARKLETFLAAGV